MGTGWSARIVGGDGHCRPVIEAVLARVIAHMSNWEPDSDISRFNATAPGCWMALPDDLLLVLQAGLEVASASNGAFDPALGHPVADWGFGPPSPYKKQYNTDNYRTIEIVNDRCRRLADVALDLSGIAKGYAVDAVAEALLSLGHRNFLIEIGGELRGEGCKPGLQPWWVDLEVPPGLRLPVTRAALCGLSVATSGDYRRFRMENGQRLAHSIDPATGAPVRHPIASVSVFHPSAMYADAWATAILVSGVEPGLKLAAQEGLAVLMIVRDGAHGRELMTPALAAMLA